MVGSSFLPNRRGGHDQMAQGQVFPKGPRAAAGDQFPRADGDGFLHKTRGEGRTHAGMHDRKWLSLAFDFVGGIDPEFRPEHRDLAGLVFAHQGADDILEEAKDDPLMELPAFEMVIGGGMDENFTGGVKLKDGVIFSKGFQSCLL